MLVPFSFMKTVPVVPVATAATGVGSTSFTANWNAFSGASYYLLDVSLSSSFSTFVLQNTVTTATSYVVTGLTSSTTYYYRVRAAINVDSDVAGFVSRVYAAGGSLSYTEVTATETLVADLKGYGIWTSMKAVYPMVGASAAACAQNLKSSSFTGTFTSGWTFASTGVTPNGTSAYMDTGLNQSTQFTQTNGEIGVYSRTNSNGLFVDIGCYSVLRDYCLFANLGTMYGRAATQDIDSLYNPTTSLGLFSINADGTNTQKFYRNGVIRATLTTTTNTLSSINSYLGAANSTTSPLFYSARQYAFAYLSNTLSATNQSNFYTAVQAFQTTLSRNV